MQAYIAENTVHRVRPRIRSWGHFKKFMVGLVLWCNTPSQLPQHHHHMWVVVCVLSCSTSSLAPCFCTWDSSRCCFSPWAPTTHMGDQNEIPGSWCLALSWPRPGHCSHFGNEPKDERSLLFSTSLWLCLSKKKKSFKNSLWEMEVSITLFWHKNIETLA